MNGPDREPLADILRGETRFWRDVHAPLLKSFVDDLLYNGSRHIDNRNDDGESYYFLSRLLAILLWLFTAGGGRGGRKSFRRRVANFEIGTLEGNWRPRVIFDGSVVSFIFSWDWESNGGSYYFLLRVYSAIFLRLRASSNERRKEKKIFLKGSYQFWNRYS